jgi:hypothetical protein
MNQGFFSIFHFFPLFVTSLFPLFEFSHFSSRHPFPLAPDRAAAGGGGKRFPSRALEQCSAPDLSPAPFWTFPTFRFFQLFPKKKKSPGARDTGHVFFSPHFLECARRLVFWNFRKSDFSAEKVCPSRVFM